MAGRGENEDGEGGGIGVGGSRRRRIERMQIWQGGGVGIRDGRGGAFSSRAGRGEKARKSTDPKLRQKCVNWYSDICSAL